MIRKVETTNELPGSIVFHHGVSKQKKIKNFARDKRMNSDPRPNKPSPISDHYATHLKIHSLNSFYGAIVGLEMCKTWKYNNATRWTKCMLVLGTATAVYSLLLVITQPKKIIEVFSLFAVIAPVSIKVN